MEEVANRVNSTLEKYPVNKESSVKKYPVNENSTPKKYPVKRNTNKPVGRTAQRIIYMVISNPMITREKMANELGISLDGVKKQIKNLRDRGILIHEGSDKAGYWRIVINPQTEQSTYGNIFHTIQCYNCRFDYRLFVCLLTAGKP